MPREYGERSTVDNADEQTLVKVQAKKRAAPAEGGKTKRRKKREAVRWFKGGRLQKTTYRTVSDRVSEPEDDNDATTAADNDIEVPDPLENDSPPELRLEDAWDWTTPEFSFSEPTQSAELWPFANTTFVDFSWIPASRWTPALKDEEETEAGYLAIDLYNPSERDQDESHFSTITTAPRLDVDLNLYVKPSTNGGDRAHCLNKIRFAWDGPVEEKLVRVLHPSGEPMSWDRKLLVALAKLSFLATTEIANPLLLEKCRGRKLRLGRVGIVAGEVYEVIERLEAKET